MEAVGGEGREGVEGLRSRGLSVVVGVRIGNARTCCGVVGALGELAWRAISGLSGCLLSTVIVVN